ncbi:MAG: hypothetical protein L6R42_001768 [Xanthoria sp. 1 TBL-2021]|nr:MAG: hypothetical protein L6R42_001768 [Xanthoria sp. 1 TBL-2021]
MSSGGLGREARHETSNFSRENTKPVPLAVDGDSNPNIETGYNGSTTPPEGEPPSAPTKPHSNTPDCRSEVTYPEGGLRAWLVVLGSFSGMLASFGLMNIVGTFQAYLTTHQLANESPSTVGWIFSIYVFLAFGCGLQIGPIFDRKGSRWLVFAGSVCLVVGMIGVSESTKFWHFILTFSILGGVGTSLIFTPAVGAIAHFFSRRRGAATGLAATGGSFGGIIFPLALEALFPKVGFAWSVRLLALIFLVLLIIANLLIRARLPPKVGGNVWPDFRIFGDVTFALTTAGVFFIEWGLFVPLSFISSYALANGVNTTFSYQLLAILNAGSVFGRAVPGYVADRLGRFNTMIATVALCLISSLGIWLNVGGNVAGLCVFAVLFGFASGSNISLTPVCVGQLCEAEVFGRCYGTMYTIVSIGCLTGIPIAGEILARNEGDYWGLIVFTGLSYAAGLICFTTARILKVGWKLTAVY